MPSEKESCNDSRYNAVFVVWLRYGRLPEKYSNCANIDPADFKTVARRRDHCVKNVEETLRGLIERRISVQEIENVRLEFVEWKTE